MNHDVNPDVEYLREHAAKAGRTVFPVVPCELWPRDLGDRCVELMKMAMAEAGHPVKAIWSESLNAWLFPVGTPESLTDRARVLAYSHLGIEFEVRPTTAEVAA